MCHLLHIFVWGLSSVAAVIVAFNEYGDVINTKVGTTSQHNAAVALSLVSTANSEYHYACSRENQANDTVKVMLSSPDRLISALHQTSQLAPVCRHKTSLQTIVSAAEGRKTLR